MLAFAAAPATPSTPSAPTQPARPLRPSLPQLQGSLLALALVGCGSRRLARVSRRSGDDDGGPVALVLRSRLAELAKTSSAQRAAERWQERQGH